MLFGMRIVKTALAITISAYVAMWFNLSSPFFVAMAALITMQGNLVDSFSMAKYRILGTILGAAFGIALAYTVHGHPIVLGLGIGIIIFACNKLRWNKAIAIATIVFASIMLGYEETSFIYESYHRIVDTTVGIVVAIVVNFAISRPYSRDKVIRSTTDMIIKCKEIISKLICQQCDFDLSEIKRDLDIIEMELPGLKTEAKMHIISNNQDLDFDLIKSQIDELYHNTYLLAEMKGTFKLNEFNVKTINEMYGTELTAQICSDEASIVYNYHLSICLRLIRKLSDSFSIPINQDVHRPVRGKAM